MARSCSDCAWFMVIQWRDLITPMRAAFSAAPFVSGHMPAVYSDADVGYSAVNASLCHPVL
ncbi:MAG: hypothetical protein LBB48_04895 [Treponema sp.]|nr:hypothetical protein [Treponema sp.]